jgi:hypothetical protein
MLLLSTACFPPVEYFAYLVQYGGAIIDLHETYPKQTWRNRYMITGGNGPIDLTVPVEKPLGNQTPTNSIIISNHCQWRQNHWKTICSAYRNAPYFLYYAHLIEDLLLNEKTEKLFELNHKIMHALIEEMHLQVSLEYAVDFIAIDANKNDFRFSLHPKTKNKTSASLFPPYYQVFEDRHGFIPNASIIDLLFNLGPDTPQYLAQLGKNLEKPY